MTPMDFIKLAFRMGGSIILRRIKPTIYKGDAQQICKQVIQNCYDNKRKYFCTSISTYKELWTRDFGRSAPALINCGYTDEVRNTYRFAFNAYKKQRRYALTVLPNGGLYDFPFGTYSPDGYAFFLYGLCALKDSNIIDEYAGLLNEFTTDFFSKVICPDTLMVKSQVHFSEARDYVKRSSSSYSNSMCFIVQQALNNLGLQNPLKDINYPDLLEKNYYNEKNNTFYDDDSKPPYISGDTTVLPFWSGAMARLGNPDITWEKTFNQLEQLGFNTPCPTRYGINKKGPTGIRLHWLNPWQKDAVWTCLGMHFLETTALYKPECLSSLIAKFEELIPKWGGFPEVLDPVTIKPFKSLFYTGETGMLWAANFLALLLNPQSFRHEHLL